MHDGICYSKRCPIAEMLHFHGSNGNGNHVTVMSVKARKELAGHYGCLVTEEGSAEVQHYVEKVCVSHSVHGRATAHNGRIACNDVRVL